LELITGKIECWLFWGGPNNTTKIQKKKPYLTQISFAKKKLIGKTPGIGSEVAAGCCVSAV
jgi:hypothetical protein